MAYLRARHHGIGSRLPEHNAFGNEFLTLATILVVIAYAGGVGYNGMENRAVVGGYLAGILNSILVFVVPAAVVVALKEMSNLAKD